MLYGRIDDCPPEVQALSPEQAQLWLRTYNRVFQQSEDVLASTLAAWGAVDKTKFRSVKSLAGGREVVGWAMMFTDEDDLDLHGTHFSHLTSLFLEYYPQAPLWYEHGYDPDYGYLPVGQRMAESVRIYAHGVLMGHSLHLNHTQYDRTVREADAEELKYSSDSIGHYVEQGFNFLINELRAWPFAGCSLTKSPAEPGLGRVALRSVAGRLEKLFADRPRKVFPTPNRDREGAGGAKGSRSGAGTSTTNTTPRKRATKGKNKMDPEMLAQLASFFGVEATVEAVRQVLEQAIAALEEETTSEEELQSVLRAAPAALRSAFELDADASNADLADALRDILNTVADEDEPDVAVIGAALKSARGQREERNHLPVKHSPARWGKSVNVNRGNAKRPGLLDVIGAASRKSGGNVQFDMPAFDKRVSPDKAMKAMDILSGPNGGYTLNREMSDDILEHLYSVLIFDRLGVQNVPMSGLESLTLNRQVSGATASWTAPGQGVTAANPKVRGAVTLQLRELVAESIQENKLLRHSSQNLEQMIQNDMIAVMARKMELAFLYGSGGVPADGSSTGAEPLGLYHMTGVTQTSLVSKVPTVDDFIDCEGRVEDADLDYGYSPAWISHNMLRRQLKKMKNGDGDPLYSASWMEVEVGGTKKRVREMDLNGIPLLTSTQVPVTTTGAVKTTDVFHGDFSYALIGQGQDFEVVVDTSVLVRNRQTLLQIVSECDFGLSYKEAVQILTLAKVN